MQDAELSGSSADAPVVQVGAAALPVLLVGGCGRSIRYLTVSNSPTHMQLSSLHLPRNMRLLLSTPEAGKGKIPLVWWMDFGLHKSST